MGEVYDPFFALVVNMTGAWLLWEVAKYQLNSYLPFRPPDEREPLTALKCCGGLIGCVAISFIAVSLPRIGFVVYFLLTVGGQITGALSVDLMGFAGSPKRDIWVFHRMLGLLFVTVGVIMAGLGSSSSSDDSDTDTPEGVEFLVYCCLGFLSGHLFPYQAAVNAAAARTSAYPSFGALMSFRGAAICSSMIFIATRFLVSDSGDHTDSGQTFWKLDPKPVKGVNIPDNINGTSSSSSPSHAPAISWFSGVIGAVHVFIVFTFTRIIGVTVTFVLVLTGILIASLPLDETGFFDMMPKREVRGLRILGVVVVVIGVVFNVFGENNFIKQKIKKGTEFVAQKIGSPMSKNRTSEARGSNSGMQL